MNLSRDELARQLTEIFSGYEFEPRDGALAEGKDVAVQLIPLPLGQSGVCHLLFELLPEGEYEPLRVRLRQTSRSGTTVTREAVSDTTGRTRLRYLLMKEPCALEVLPASDPGIEGNTALAYRSCECLAGPANVEAGGCIYRTVAHRGLGSGLRTRSRSHNERQGRGGGEAPPSPVPAGGAPTDDDELSFEAAGDSPAAVQYLHATAYQPADRRFSVILDQTPTGRTAITVSTRDPQILAAEVVARLGHETKVGVFGGVIEPSPTTPRPTGSEVQLDFSIPYRSAVQLKLSIDFLVPD